MHAGVKAIMYIYRVMLYSLHRIIPFNISRLAVVAKLSGKGSGLKS